MRTEAKTGKPSGPRRAEADSALAEMARSCSVGGGLLLTVLGFWWRIFQHTEAKTDRRIGLRRAEAFFCSYCWFGSSNGMEDIGTFYFCN